MRLYEISENYRSFLEMVEAGEIPLEAIADTLDAISGELSEKADNTACIYKSLLADAEAIKSEEDTLCERRKAKEKEAAALKEYLSYNLLAAGMQKIETARNKITFRKSTSLLIDDEETFKQKNRALCQEEVKLIIPKKALTDMLKSGADIEGASLKENLNIQIK